MLTMRSEGNENFRLVRPMMMAVICEYAENRRRTTNQCAPSVVELPLCLQCLAVGSGRGGRSWNE